MCCTAVRTQHPIACKVITTFAVVGITLLVLGLLGACQAVQLPATAPEWILGAGGILIITALLTLRKLHA